MEIRYVMRSVDVLIVNVLLNLNQTITNFCLLLLHFIQQSDDNLPSPTRCNPHRKKRVLSQTKVGVARKCTKQNGKMMKMQNMMIFLLGKLNHMMWMTL